MAPSKFDDRNIKWNTLTLPPVGELKHLLFSILNVDEENHIVHVPFKFAATAYARASGKSGFNVQNRNIGVTYSSVSNEQDGCRVCI